MTFNIDMDFGYREPLLDTIGKVPVVGTVSGALRIFYGVQKVAFSALACLASSIGAAVCLVNEGAVSYWGDATTDGVLHVGRGIVELIPLIGTVILNLYDEEMRPFRVLVFLADKIYG